MFGKSARSHCLFTIWTFWIWVWISFRRQGAFFFSLLKLCHKLYTGFNPRTFKGWGGEGWLPPSSKVILIFFLDDKTSASEVFCSSLFIPRAHSETSLVMVSYFGYEIRRDRWSNHFWVKMHVFSIIKVKLVNKMMQSNYLFYFKLKLPSGRSQEDGMLQKTKIWTIGPSFRSLWPTVSELFAETFHAPLQSFVWRRHIDVPFWSTNMAAGNQQKHHDLRFTFPTKALSFHSRTSIRAHKHIF